MGKRNKGNGKQQKPTHRKTQKNKKNKDIKQEITLTVMWYSIHSDLYLLRSEIKCIHFSCAICMFTLFAYTVHDLKRIFVKTLLNSQETPMF